MTKNKRIDAYETAHIDLCHIVDDLKFDYDIIIGRCRKHKYVYMRCLVAKQLRDLGYSSLQIGHVMKKDHTTILHYLKRIKEIDSHAAPQHKAS